MLRKSLIGGLALTAVAFAAVLDTRLSDAAMQGDKESVRALLKQKADVNAAQGDGSTALHWAAYRDDVDMVKLLLAAGANVNAVTREGALTPLFMACQNGDAAVIGELLKAGAPVNSAKANGTTPLMLAAASGSADAVKVLLDHDADVKAKESVHGQTALMFAAALNRAAVIRLLMAHGAEPNLATSVRKLERVRFDQDGNVVEEKPAAAANKGAAGAAEASPEASKVALDTLQKDLDVFAKSIGLQSAELRIAKAKSRAGDVAARPPRKVGPDFMGGMTALLYAAREGHMDAVKSLVETGADVNEVSGDKISPMVMAIMNGHFDIGKYLLDHGADPNLVSMAGLTALYATVDVQWAPKAWFPQPSTDQEKTTYLDLMKALLAKGANPNTPINEKLWFRSFTNDYTWVDPAGATAFWRAAQSSDIEAMKLLVAHGADPKTPTKAGDTPLHAAAGIGWAANWSVNAPYPAVDAVKYCVELGNEVNAVDNRGYTPLHGAAYLGNNDMVNYLVSKGAKVTTKSKAGDTVADMANGPTRFGQPHLETVALLEKLGSPNSHNCRSDQCVVAARAQIYQLTPADYAQKDSLDQLAVAIGLQSAEYRVDAPVRGQFGGRGGGQSAEAAPATPATKEEPAPPAKPKGPGLK
ncbi:MAG TPA: ankyrin repeat domain-containing protein [Bryobacteraceae bacterium]|nr:ankyrin repeat domain-containing protein [Bryobacteraceae bacterium]